MDEKLLLIIAGQLNLNGKIGLEIFKQQILSTAAKRVDVTEYINTLQHFYKLDSTLDKMISELIAEHNKREVNDV